MSSTSEKYAAAEEATLDALTTLAGSVGRDSAGPSAASARAEVIEALANALSVIQTRSGPNEWTD